MNEYNSTDLYGTITYTFNGTAFAPGTYTVKLVNYDDGVLMDSATLQVNNAVGSLSAGNYAALYNSGKTFNVRLTESGTNRAIPNALVKLVFKKGSKTYTRTAYTDSSGYVKINPNIPVGTLIHNIEINPNQGAKLVRVAGQSARLMAKEGKYAHLRLPSGEMRLVLANCKATIGEIGNEEHENIKLGKAGKTRHLGKRPEVRGSAMNPNDHPHGGGEGKAPVGHAGPMTPWGKPALGYKTRAKHKKSDKLITKRRK